MSRKVKQSGIYQIRNTVSGGTYIGSAVDLWGRWATHLHLLRHNRHKNRILQASFTKHGEAAFLFEILEECPRELTLVREQYYLDTLKPRYNINKLASSRLGTSPSAETRRKVSEALKGRPGKPLTPEARRKISEAHTGRVWSRDHVEARRQSAIKTLADPEKREAMAERMRGSRNPFYGKTHPPEVLERIRVAKQGSLDLD